MYGKRQPIAVRKPLPSTRPRNQKASTLSEASNQDSTEALTTPPVIEGETASESDFETNFEVETPTGRSSDSPAPSMHESLSTTEERLAQPPASEHDLYHKYFRRDIVGLRNIDLLR
jgi:phosphatidylethanolamine N-methyltransferase